MGGWEKVMVHRAVILLRMALLVRPPCRLRREGRKNEREQVTCPHCPPFCLKPLGQTKGLAQRTHACCKDASLGASYSTPCLGGSGRRLPALLLRSPRNPMRRHQEQTGKKKVDTHSIVSTVRCSLGILTVHPIPQSKDPLDRSLSRSNRPLRLRTGGPKRTRSPTLR